jgi:transposase
LTTLFADGGYQGPQFAKALAKVLPHLDVEIVKRSDAAIGFKIIPKRWIVERTIAWLNRCRRRRSVLPREVCVVFRIRD